jgi:hypothetical protein
VIFERSVDATCGTPVASVVGMTDSRLRASPSVRSSISPDGLVLLDVQGGMLLASNPIGARIWELLERQRSCAEIATQLVVDYDVPIVRAEHDVAAFVAELTARGLLVEEPTC